MYFVKYSEQTQPQMKAGMKPSTFPKRERKVTINFLKRSTIVMFVDKKCFQIFIQQLNNCSDLCCVITTKIRKSKQNKFKQCTSQECNESALHKLACNGLAKLTVVAAEYSKLRLKESIKNINICNKRIIIYKLLILYLIEAYACFRLSIQKIIINTLKYRMQKQELVQVDNTIKLITNKLEQIKVPSLHPPYFPKYVTKYREQFYQSMKNNLKLYLNNNTSKITGQQRLRVVKTIKYFIDSFDEKYFDTYLQELRQPYIRKIFQQNYGFDDVDFKQANNEYHLRTEIENVLSNASEWLLQVQQTQDLLNRIDLYFGIKTPTVTQRLKKQGMESSKGGWMDTFSQNMKSLSTFALKKGSKIIQANFFTAMAPAAAMMTFAIMGGTSKLPWKTDLNLNSFIPAMMVVIIPFMLDSMAQGIQKSKLYGILEKWAQSFEKMSANIRKYNEFLTESINKCVSVETQQKLDIQITNLEKYITLLSKDLKSIEQQSEDKFEQMRERTEAYFKKYTQIQQGQWTIVLPKANSDDNK